MKRQYGTVEDKDTYLYTVRGGDIEADVGDFGARINALRVGGTDIALGFNSVGDYIKSGCNAGATIGRVANRIAKGTFSLNGKVCRLGVNDGENHLHGGREGFGRRLFTVTAHTENSLTLEYASADGEEGYPGNLRLSVTYGIENNALEIRFAATSDKDTLWGPTNHTYFNLDGESVGDCKNNILKLNADLYTPADGALVPTGEKRRVSGTPLDFTVPKRIGEGVESKQLSSTLGYDHNFILCGSLAAHAESLATGIKMDVYTDLPCLQFYSGGQLSGAVGKNGIYNRYAGFCLEPQFCPNAVNLHGFAIPILRRGETASHYIKFVFAR